jgi:hypothetical protein
MVLGVTLQAAMLFDPEAEPSAQELAHFAGVAEPVAAQRQPVA